MSEIVYKFNCIGRNTNDRRAHMIPYTCLVCNNKIEVRLAEELGNIILPLEFITKRCPKCRTIFQLNYVHTYAN